MKTHKKFEENEKKFENLILYLSHLCESDTHFGATKLNKLLFYTDFTGYRMFGKPVTGYEYRRLDHGPVPTKMKQVMTRMQREKKLAIQVEDVYGKERKRTIPLVKPNLDGFTADELTMIQMIVRSFAEHNATSISELSHRFIGWKAARNEEPIPYQIANISPSKPTPELIQFAKNVWNSLNAKTPCSSVA